MSRLLTISGRVAVGGFLIAAMPLVVRTSEQAAGSGQSAELVYAVVSPAGERTIKMMAMAPRLHDIGGKTICLVWNNAFKADVTLPVIGDALKERFPQARVVPYRALPVAPLPEPPGASQTESQALQAAYTAQGCNAVIAGNGG